LYTHKEDVEATNLREIAALRGTSKKYEAQDSDPHMSRTLDNLCPAASCIELKVGAQVSHPSMGGGGTVVVGKKQPLNFQGSH